MAKVFVAVLVSWYLAVGLQINSYAEAGMRRSCPGHATIYDRWPWLAGAFMVAVWPVTAPMNILTEAIDAMAPGHLVCDRFD